MVYYRALYPFESRSHDEITIQPGDIVMVRKTPAKACFLLMVSICPLFVLYLTIVKWLVSVKSSNPAFEFLKYSLTLLPFLLE